MLFCVKLWRDVIAGFLTKLKYVEHLSTDATSYQSKDKKFNQLLAVAIKSMENLKVLKTNSSVIDLRGFNDYKFHLENFLSEWSKNNE